MCPSSCTTGTYTFHNNVCYANAQDCDVRVDVKGTSTKVGVGRQTYTSNGAYNTCQVTSCIAGYDSTQGDGTTCAKTETGYFSSANQSGRTACQRDGRTNGNINPQAGQTKLNEHASWQGTGLSSVSQCQWECDSTYRMKVNRSFIPVACIPLEAIDRFTLYSSQYQTIGSKWVRVPSGSRDTNIREIDINIFTSTLLDKSNFYVTHVPPGTWKPTTTTAPTAHDGNSANTWKLNSYAHRSYTIPDSVSSGEITLYAYVADTSGNVRSPVLATTSFYLDVDPPVITIGSKPTDDIQLGGDDITFSVSARDLPGATLTYQYCLGSSCTNSADFTSISASALRSVVVDLASDSMNVFGTKTITFQVTDPSGNIGRASYSWDYHLCPIGTSKREVGEGGGDIEKGGKTVGTFIRKCTTGEKWSVLTVSLTTDDVCTPDDEEDRVAADGDGRGDEHRICATDGKSWSSWKFKSCASRLYFEF